MFKRLLRLAATETVAAFLQHVGGILLGSGVFAAVMGWIAAATDWVSAWGPIGWGTVAGSSFLLAVLVFSAASLMRAKAKLSNAEASVNQAFVQRGVSIDPRVDTFYRRRINIMDFFSPIGRPNVNKYFNECEFVDPGVLRFTGQVQGIGGDFPNCDFVRIADEVPIYNSIAMENCTINHCRFYRITMLIYERDVETFKMLKPDIVWLNDPPAVSAPSPSP